MEKPKFRSENFRGKNLFVYLDKADENGEVLSTSADKASGRSEDDIQRARLDFTAVKIKLNEIGKSTEEAKEMLATMKSRLLEFNTLCDDEDFDYDNVEVYDVYDEEIFWGEQDDDENLLKDNGDEEEIWRQALQGDQATCIMVECDSKEGEKEEEHCDFEEDSQDSRKS